LTNNSWVGSSRHPKHYVNLHGGTLAGDNAKSRPGVSP
jgi:hypothetical protein